MDERNMRRPALLVTSLTLLVLGNAWTAARAESPLYAYTPHAQALSTGEGECSGLAGDTNLDCVVDIVELQSCIAMFLRLLLADPCVDSNGDDAVDIVELQTCIAGFLKLLSCPSGCGDGVVDPPEECEADEDCPLGEGCLYCECREKVGTRIFSSNPSATGSGFFSSSFTGPLLPLGGVEGSITLDGGPQDDDGMALITTLGGPFYLAVDILAGTQGRFCMRIESCDGFIDCDGGTNVDVETKLDSLADGLICEAPVPPASCDPENTCCTNACEGFIPGTDPPVPVTSGNSSVVTTGVNASDSGAGAVLLTCAVRQVDISPAEATDQISQGMDVMTACLAADYSGDTFDQVVTTGTSTGTVINECLSPLGSASIAKSGENFSCPGWTTENGSGSFVFVAVAEEPRDVTAGDNANAGVVKGGPS
jgi:hypothetical protein